MKNEICELVFVLDRSGSMYGLESDTAGGFNRVLEEQKNGKGQRMWPAGEAPHCWTRWAAPSR